MIYERVIEKKIISLDFFRKESLLVTVLENGDISFVDVNSQKIIIDFPTEPNITSS